MKRVSLISNSSIQYYKFDSEVDLDFGRQHKIFYHQPFDSNILDFIFDPLFKVTFEGMDTFYRRQELIDKDFLIHNQLKEDADLSTCKIVSDHFEASNLRNALKHFKKKWIPLPYFKDNSINKDLMYPTDWVRLYFDCDDQFQKVKLVLAVDTTLAKSVKDLTGPQLSLNPSENIFKIHSNENGLSTFLFNNNPATAWIEGYLADCFYEGKDALRFEQPIRQYVAQYILLVKWFESLPESPDFQLFTDDMKKIPVDLVIDIGNSATCALLFENQNEDNFNFEKVKKIILQDYSNPELEYDQPFPMNLVFRESNFGNTNSDKYHNNKFIVPSFVRIGFEAENFINNSNINLTLGREIKTTNSSPKRYLWDASPAETEWEFYPKDLNKIKKVYLNGISEQLKIDGSLTDGEVFGTKSLFSRKSLMKFVFLELLIHAYVQINSFRFREEHGNLTVPRTLKRITISCPTGMIQYEQIALRAAAEDACKLLNNYVKFYFDSADNKFWFEIPEIIPSIKDIAKKLPDLEDRKDWMYDEATSCQLVFIYSLLSKKLLGNNYVIDNYLFKNKENLTVGSIDIGAGTTDFVINNYSLNREHKSINIKPDPQYWDSYKLAGDDLLKEIIQEIIIEGIIKTDADRGCTGVIENFARDKGVQNVSDKLNGFFGDDSNKFGYVAKMMRSAFAQQVSIPIALFYLRNANNEQSSTMTFEQIIGSEFKNVELIKYFERHFGFSFLEIKWLISPQKVNSIVGSVFDNILKQLCLVANQFQCDYVVISGKPASLNSIEEIFLKYLSILPHKLINLNNYWIGKWFPFSDNRGYIQDPKTVVSVGAIIALMAGKLNKINDLKIDTELMKQKIVSSAEYIVKRNLNNKEIILSPTNHERTIIVNSLPFQFGFAKFISKNYPVSDLYKISIDTREILSIAKLRHPGKEKSFYEDHVNIEINRILQHLPLEVTLTRDFTESKEELKIDSVVDAEGNDKPNKYFKLNYQTLGDENGYWLDTCGFVLNARQ
jgi:hypothetical protein